MPSLRSEMREMMITKARDFLRKLGPSYNVAKANNPYDETAILMAMFAEQELGVSPQDEVVKSSAPDGQGRPRGEVEYWSETEPLRGVMGSTPSPVDTSVAEQDEVVKVPPGQHMERRDRTDAHDAKVGQVPAAFNQHCHDEDCEDCFGK